MSMEENKIRDILEELRDLAKKSNHYMLYVLKGLEVKIPVFSNKHIQHIDFA